MNSFVNDVFERIASEASRLAKYSKRSTLSSREIQVGKHYNQRIKSFTNLDNEVFTDQNVQITNFSFILQLTDGCAPHSAWRAVEARRVRGNQGHHQIHGQQDAQVVVLLCSCRQQPSILNLSQRSSSGPTTSRYFCSSLLFCHIHFVLSINYCSIKLFVSFECF